MYSRLFDSNVLVLPGTLRRVAAGMAGLISQRAAPPQQKRQLPDAGLDHGPRRSRRTGGWDGGPSRGPGGIRAWLRSAWRRHRSRRQITRMDAHLLRDIGITYAEAEAEANKPFWRT